MQYVINILKYFFNILINYKDRLLYLNCLQEFSEIFISATKFTSLK